MLLVNVVNVSVVNCTFTTVKRLVLVVNCTVKTVADKFEVTAETVK